MKDTGGGGGGSGGRVGRGESGWRKTKVGREGKRAGGEGRSGEREREKGWQASGSFHFARKLSLTMGDVLRKRLVTWPGTTDI